MAKQPPLNMALTVCKSLNWTKHFEPAVNVKEDSRPSLRCIPPYPDLSTIMHLCSDSYMDSPKCEIIPNFWKRLWSVTSSKSGYFGGIYVNESDKQLVLVHRGTNLKNLKAIVADVHIYFKTISDQMLSAMTCSHELKEEMKRAFPGWKLIVTGHSLGSYLTDVSIFSLMYLEPNETGEVFCKRRDVEDSSVVNILPYGIGIDGPGSFDIISKLRDLIDVRYGTRERIRVEDLPVDHFVGVANVVNCQHRQVGGLYQIPIESRDKTNYFSKFLKYMDDRTFKLSTHFLENFISTFTEKKPSSIKQVVDFPTGQRERASVNFNSFRVTDGDYAAARYQVTDITREKVELRFFSSHVQQLLCDLDKLKRFTNQLQFLLENVPSDDREFISKVLTSLTVEKLVCFADGMNKEELIPWINEFFVSNPLFVAKDTVISSMCSYIFPCQKELEFKCDPLSLEFEFNSLYIIEAGDTSIAAKEVEASLDHLRKKYFVLKTSEIKRLEKIFKFDGDIKNFEVIVIEQDIVHDITNFSRCLNLNKIVIRYNEKAPIVRCKVDDLTDECKKRLLSTEICLQGKTVKLHDLGTEISDALFHPLLQGRLRKIPKCADIDPSNNYIDIKRTLKKSVNNRTVQQNVLNEMELSKILMISDLPGAGKTTFVTKLSLELNDWVIKVNLNEKSEVLAKWHKEKRNIIVSASEDLLSELAGIDPSLKPLLQSVIDDPKSEVKICVICDAVDEVSAIYVRLVIEFIKRLKCESKISNIIVTTRPHLKDELENSLQTESYSLKPFEYSEQIEFIEKSIAKPYYPRGRVQDLFNKFCPSIAEDVRGTPMMLQLIAEKLQELKEDSVSNLSLHSLYRDHIQNIFREYVEVKAGAQKNKVISREIQDNLIFRNLNFYYYYAIKELLHLDDSEVELYGLKRPSSNDERDTILRHGLVVGTNLFKHKSFAEFFLAKWLMSNDSRPQVHKVFVDVISISFNDSNQILVFFEGEAHDRCIVEAENIEKDKKNDKEKRFFEQIANEIIAQTKTEHGHGMLHPHFPKLTRYIFDGLRRFCGESTLQRILINQNESSILHRTYTLDQLNFVMTMFDEAGLTVNSPKSGSSGMSKILKSTFLDQNILFYRHTLVQLPMFKLLEDYLHSDDIIKLITAKCGRYNSNALNSCLSYLVDLCKDTDWLFNALKWHLRILKAADREIELMELIFDVYYRDYSIWRCFPHIVHQTMKEMNSSLLSSLPKVFHGQPSIWTRSLTRESFLCDNVEKKLRYICDEMFLDQYGDEAAEAFHSHVLDYENGIKSNLRLVASKSPYYYVTFSAISLEMAVNFGLSYECVQSLADDVIEYTCESSYLDDLLFTFVKFGLPIAVKKLLIGVETRNSGKISIHTVDVNRMVNGRTPLEIAKTFDDNKHKMVVEAIEQHLGVREPHY